MARLNVVWTETALKQRNVIFEYWNDRNKSTKYSKILLSQINERTSQLSEHPELGKTADFKNTRVISLGHFRVFYQVRDDRVIITAFWDNRNDPEKLLRILRK